jgi:protein-tyrosine phosphatase
MRDQYAKMLPRFAPQYREMFQELLAGDAPLAFNCSAGKDRTGVAAALLLTALGVPRPTVMEDYLLSNRHLNVDRAMQAGKQGPGGLKALPDDVLKVYLSVDPEFLGAVFEIIDAHKDGVDGYLRDELGLGSAEIG